MDANKKLKILTQLFPIVIGLVFLCIFFYYMFGVKDSLMADVFLGASIGIFSIGIVNIISILITDKAEIEVLDNYKNDIAEKVRTNMLCDVGFDEGTFDQVIKKTLLPAKDYEKIEILAYTSEQFLETLNEIDFNCNELIILLQNTEINEKSVIIKKWEKFFINKKGEVKQISINKSRNKTDKLICGLVINDNQQGVIGFYAPGTDTVKTLNIFGINRLISGHSELLNVINKWFDFYSRDKVPIKTIPDKDLISM